MAKRLRCGCEVDVNETYATQEVSVDFCPTHKAAPALLEALERLASIYDDGAIGLPSLTIEPDHTTSQGQCESLRLMLGLEVDSAFVKARAAIRAAKGETR